MLIFIQKCGATSKTAEDLCNFIMDAKKPSKLRFEGVNHSKNSPTKIQCNIELWNEVHVDLIGPWMILQAMPFQKSQTL
jgi:hypothetical protein